MSLMLGIGIGIPLDNHLGGELSFPTTGIPQVTGSVISPIQASKIFVKWDRPMEMTCDIKDQIHVVINSGAPALPTGIVFNGDNTEMGIVMAANFQTGDAVDWSYDPAGTCDLIQTAFPNTEADGISHVVVNQALISHLWTDEFFEPWKDEFAETWINP